MHSTIQPRNAPPRRVANERTRTHGVRDAIHERERSEEQRERDERDRRLREHEDPEDEPRQPAEQDIHQNRERMLASIGSPYQWFAPLPTLSIFSMA